MNICVSAGGTGGHIYPAIALADALIEKGHTIFYIGNHNKMEAQIVKDKPYTFLPIENEGLKPGLMAKVKGITSQFKAIWQSRKYLKEHQIDVLISFGGYVTFPACVAARQLKIPYYIHEQNSIAGKANKAVQKGSEGIIVCFEEVIKQFNHPDIRFYGNPRASVAASIEKDESYLESIGLRSDLPIVYFVMGSLGSSSMGEMVVDYLNEHQLTDYQFVISTGSKNKEIYDALKPQDNVKLFETVDQLQMLKHCLLVISRAGATSIAEISAALMPVIYVPSPYVVANHQYYNALACEKEGAAVLIEEKELDSKKLFGEIDKLLKDSDKRQSMSEAAQSIAKVDAIDNIIRWVES